MSSFNLVVLMGNLTRDPELRASESGLSICRFGIAINKGWNKKDGQDRADNVVFVDVVVFGQTADFVNQYFHKGKPILVEGRLNQTHWEQDGQKRSRLEVIANRVHFVGRSSDQEASYVPDAKPQTSSPGKKGNTKKADEGSVEIDKVNIDEVPF